MRFALRGRLRWIAKSVLNVSILLAVYGLGVGIGSGRIVFGRDALLRKSQQKNLPNNLNYKEVEQAYDELRQSFDGELKLDKLQDGLKAGLVKAAGDPYTEYFNPEETKGFDEQLNGSFEGIGAELSKTDKDIVIVSPLSGFPAEKAGLKPRDVIAEIDGKSAYDLTTSAAVKLIRGTKGTQVKLTIVRAGSQILHFEITRDQINIPSVKSEILAGNIGYIHISRFGEDTTTLSRQAAQKFKAANVKGVILDMRGDPGGLLESAVDVSSLWLQNKTVLQEKRGGVVIHTYLARGEPTLLNIPTVVLIDDGSASASEITAGALHDNSAAKIMGVKSFGKGSVQELRPLVGGGELKITVARWYTPSGRNIDKEGIVPDIEVKITADDVKAGKDPQKDAAIKDLEARF